MANILIVDDSPETVEILSLAVSILGHEPVSAYGGTQALEMTAKSRPDLVLLDLMMPDVDGYEILRRLRAQAGVNGMPVVVITAAVDPCLQQKVEQAGGNGCVQKPVSLEALSEMISQQLGQSKKSGS